MYFVSIIKPSLISHFMGSHTDSKKQKEVSSGGLTWERAGREEGLFEYGLYSELACG